MNNKQAIEQLKDLRMDRKSFLTEDSDEVYTKDIEALDIAIKALEGTAQEVELKNANEVEIFIREAKEAETNNLEKICKPVALHLQEGYGPHTSVIITDGQIRLVKDEIGIPVRSDDQVLVSHH